MGWESGASWEGRKGTNDYRKMMETSKKKKIRSKEKKLFVRLVSGGAGKRTEKKNDRQVSGTRSKRNQKTTEKGKEGGLGRGFMCEPV